VNTEKANTELFHLHLHYAWMPISITKIIINESRENKEAASPCWSPSAILRDRRLEIFCLLLMAVNSCEVPVNGKKWDTLYFVRMSEPPNTEHADSEDCLYLDKHSMCSCLESNPNSPVIQPYLVTTLTELPQADLSIENNMIANSGHRQKGASPDDTHRKPTSPSPSTLHQGPHGTPGERPRDQAHHPATATPGH
jgi:hypothetical protein